MSGVVGTMTIRSATAQDLPEVLLLERETATAPHWPVAEYAGIVQGEVEGSRMRRVLFVAVDGRVVQGFAVGKVAGGEAELESVAVRAGERRQGVGSALCRAVLRWSRVLGAGVVMLEVRAGSTGAIRLYGGLGFVAAGRRGGYYSSPDEDAVVMRCELGGAVRGETVEEPWLAFEG